MSRIILAFSCFFRILLNGVFAKELQEFLRKDDKKDLPHKELPEKNEEKKDEIKIYGSRIFTLLQREGRFIDFLQEKIDSYSDAQIGAVARSLHGGCNKVMDNYIKIESVIDREEGLEVTVEKEEFDPSSIQIVGHVTGDPPFKGILRHHGWKVTEINLPGIPEGQNPAILQPAEVEII